MNTPDVDLYKYPRTHHIAGSRLQPGDEDLSSVPFAAVAGRHLVVEEKVDGANAAISFGGDGTLRLQSRGHYLVGGARERHFDLFKRWAAYHAPGLRPVLGARYILYGEWLYAKHTVFYDALPHYFLEFDVLDWQTGRFLDTPARRSLLAGAPIEHVPVLFEGRIEHADRLTALIGPSRYIRPGHLARLETLCASRDLDPAHVLRETDASETMEGLYIKVEEGGAVVERYKYIRASFLSAVLQSEGHWLDRPIVPNQLVPGTDLYAARR